MMTMTVLVPREPRKKIHKSKDVPRLSNKSSPENEWQVIAYNVGIVFIGVNGFNAIKCFNECVSLSKSGYGRMSGENVYLIKNGEIIKEYHP